MRTSTSLLGGVLAAALSVAGLAPAHADEPLAKNPAPFEASRAAGLIVHPHGSVTAGVRAAASDATPRGTDVDGIRTDRDGVVVVSFDEPVSAEAARAVAAELEQRSDVATAEPDLIYTVAAAPPSSTSDTYFAQEYHLWDPRDRTDEIVAKVFEDIGAFPAAGGFGAKAPALWPATKGKPGVVVAVIDTGVRRDHPDLQGQLLNGYDFVSAPVNSNDGDGIDDDENDPGDFGNENQCGLDEEAHTSSWHGTHVAGIVAARANSGAGSGVVGVAPGVRVLPIRALGACGGTDSDIARAIEWAAGRSFNNVRKNATPAHIINLSLAGVVDQPICSSRIREAIAYARAKGATVIAAAGNEGWDLDELADYGYTVSPAMCPGVVAVAATNEYGLNAPYSNWGTPIDISAPGGDQVMATYVEDHVIVDGVDEPRGILSTLNAGTEEPGADIWAHLQGTSMAAPVVAGSAALLRSLGAFTEPGLVKALQKSVAPFPAEDAYKATFTGLTCATNLCGVGIIDLARVPAPRSLPKISGTAKAGQRLTATKGTWLGAAYAQGFSFQWYRSGKKISGATKTKYRLGSKDVGKRINVIVRPKASPYKPITATSAKTRAVKR